MPVPSSVEFPAATDAPVFQQPAPPPPHLPFRRISIPTAPNFTHRQSIVSVTSVDSAPEDVSISVSIESKNTNARKKKARSPSSQTGGRRSSRKPVDQARENKRKKVILEFFGTEKAYVDGLELIYSHFLTPIISSLDTLYPLLTRSELTAIFSNFIDIWNLHRAFFSSLSSLLTPPSPSPVTLSPNGPPAPALSPVLLSHFPYLSLYTPFITSFPTSLSTLSSLVSPSSSLYNPSFASFIQTQQQHPLCMKLTLRDWLLSIVQRCPRYLLLLKDLIGCTGRSDPEYEELMKVHSLVSKITLSLNTSLATHAQTLSLLSLQRNTISLPFNFHFVHPGRTLVKRGEVIMVERSTGERRELLLFNDCLVWLAREGGATVGTDLGYHDTTGSPWDGRDDNELNGNPVGDTPGIVRRRSKSENELPRVRARGSNPPASPSSRANPSNRHSLYPAPPLGSTTEEQPPEKWEFKGKAALVDLEVVVPRRVGAEGQGEEEERKLEVLSTEGSFVIYAASEADREAWSTSIRGAKSTLLVSLNMTHPNSTLTSSSSTAHIRRSLQALPYAPSDYRLGTIREQYLPSSKIYGRSKESGSKEDVLKYERRAVVEHWVPAIWIPDGKTEECMRCGKEFGWRRRRHHCRLCGRCVCHACSGRTFYISDPKAKGSTKPARACDACYETVFPLLDPPPDIVVTSASPDRPSCPLQSVSTLATFPSWTTLPGSVVTSATEALMAIDATESALATAEDDQDTEDGDGRIGRMKVIKRAAARPKSYHQILSDFQAEAEIASSPPPQLYPMSHERVDEEQEEHSDPGPSESPSFRRRQAAMSHSVVELSQREREKRENTTRRHKRFSLPAVALQTTSVMTRTSEGSESSPVSGKREGKRFSLVLGKGSDAKKNRDTEGVGGSSGDDHGLGRGVAAAKLSELLGRGRKAM